SLFRLMAPIPMYKAGGRLFVDVIHHLASPAGKGVIDAIGNSDPLIKDAFTTIMERGDFVQPIPDDKHEKAASNQRRPLPDFNALNEYDPAIVTDLIKRSQTSIEELKQNIQTKSGLDLMDFILEDVQHLSDPQSLGVIITAMNAASWINEK